MTVQLLLRVISHPHPLDSSITAAAPNAINKVLLTVKIIVVDLLLVLLNN
jgi:hypothetical protein